MHDPEILPSDDTSINVSVSPPMRGYIDQTIAEKGYVSAEEFVRDLIRREMLADQDRAFLRVKGELERAFDTDKSAFRSVSADDIRILAQERRQPG